MVKRGQKLVVMLFLFISLSKFFSISYACIQSFKSFKRLIASRAYEIFNMFTHYLFAIATILYSIACDCASFSSSVSIAFGS